ncbi:unnamed protein product, partial [Ixodes persulcatus]
RLFGSQDAVSLHVVFSYVPFPSAWQRGGRPFPASGYGCASTLPNEAHHSTTSRWHPASPLGDSAGDADKGSRRRAVVCFAVFRGSRLLAPRVSKSAFGATPDSSDKLKTAPRIGFRFGPWFRTGYLASPPAL